MSDQPVIHWFRRDLRLTDNTALQAALDSGAPVIPLFIFDPAIFEKPKSGAPRMAFMLEALRSLDECLREKHDSGLLVCHGQPVAALREVIEKTGATRVFFNRDYTPLARRRDKAVTEALDAETLGFDDALLVPPGEVMKQDGDPYMVYTPFMREWKKRHKPPLNDDLSGRFHDLAGIDDASLPALEDLGFSETIDVPPACEAVAQGRLNYFTGGPIYDYSEARNALMPEPFADDTLGGTSVLSPYFRLGMLSPRQAYWAARAAYENAEGRAARESVEAWVNELAWREFYMHVMYHWPHVSQHSFNREYDALEWRNAPDDLAAWQEGRTGYPLVDAAMRQLNHIGWMPNRARMVVASFLTKDLLIDWRAGERYFMQHLIDGDPAANNGGWQWSAGTGTDAQPYFRIFNPVTQSQKFDPEGTYIRHWVPELRDVTGKHIHAPWKLKEPPADYPAPIVDHKAARQRTLDAFKAVKNS